MQYENKSSKFIWENIEEGRKNLGHSIPVLVYHLFQYTLKDILTKEYDEETACRLYWRAGHLAGTEFAKNILDLSSGIDFFVTNLTNKLKEFGIGILHIEEVDLKSFSFTITVSEDLDDLGLLISGENVNDYDEGFIAGIFEEYGDHQFNVKNRLLGNKRQNLLMLSKGVVKLEVMEDG